MDLTFIDKALGSGIPYITYAVPVFFLLIGLEIAVAWWEHKRFYRLNDAVNDLSCGITEQLVGIFLKGLLFAGYLGTYGYATRQGFAVIDVASYGPVGKWTTAVLAFLGVDLAYYWFHRIAHELNAPWAGHVVHHSSEEYNLAVALRQGTFQGVFSWVFYLPLAFLGLPPLWFAALSSFDTLYQFWIHTRVIGKLGPLEWVLNTPSHHRVHHARNPQYLDKNYAGTLIIWDRMFGTFVEEQEEPVYGLTKPLSSWNPLWANFHVWVDLCRDAWLAPRWIDKLRIWVMPQGWRPEGLPPNPRAPQVSEANVVKYDAHVPRGLNSYVVLHFAGALAMAVSLMVNRRAPVAQLGPPTVLVLWSLVNFGAIFEHRRWVLPSELLRLAALVLALIVRSRELGASSLGTGVAAAVGVVLAAVSAWCLLRFRAEFDGRALEPGHVLSDVAAQTARTPTVTGELAEV